MGIKLAILGTAIGVLACTAVVGCGDDDDDMMATRCPADASAGTTMTCHCGDSGVGQATCKNDGTLGACICGDGGSAGTGSGGNGSAGTGTSGSGGQGGSSGASGSSSEEDGGPSTPDNDGGQTKPPPATNVPDDGSQFTPCERDRECNRNLGCYSPGQGGFCSQVCDRDEDCADLKGGTFHCSQSGVCSAECDGSDDDASCPAGMQCTEVGGGGGGGNGEFRCLYPAEEPSSGGAAFSACARGGECSQGLMCAGGGMGNMGFCTHSCTPQDPDCSDVSAGSGTISATCVPENPNLGVCALDCEAMPAGCPEDMECVQQGFYQLCMYMN